MGDFNDLNHMNDITDSTERTDLTDSTDLINQPDRPEALIVDPVPPSGGSIPHYSDDQAFTPAIRKNVVQALSRPSLSYWQDAWLRISKNKPALMALFAVIFLSLFVTVGPYIWKVESTHQDMNLISTPPALNVTAIVMEEPSAWDGITDQAFPETPIENKANLTAPQHLRLAAPATNHGVRIQWDPVSGAAAYTIYRNEIKPNLGSMGVPLGEVAGGNKISYEDTGSVEIKTYYYTVVPKNLNGEESEQNSLLEVKVNRAVSPSDITDLKPDAKIGDVVNLPASPLGTDSLGRDMLARLMSGGKVSLFIGFFASFLYVFIGVILGGIAGFSGGSIDAWITRAIDFVSGLPFLLFMILLKVVLSVGPGESGIGALMIALVILSWVGPARLVRGQVLQLRESEFVQAAKLMGASSGYLLWRHLIPNLLGVILVSLTFGIPTSIFTEAFLSFIGLGVASPATSWGAMCTDGLQTLLTRPHLFFLPAIFISITVLAFNILGDGLRDALDPRMRTGA